MKHVLMVAYHYPPDRISSGIQRTLKFSSYLPEHGWTPSVLTASPRAYASTSDAQLHEIPDEIDVRRAFALDTRRHLAIRGLYPQFLALPDRWSSWALGGVATGLAMIRKSRPDVIWSTYPIATAHLIGLALHRLTGIPWIADCRDSMTEEGYPEPAIRRKVYLWLERQAVTRATKVVFTAPRAAEMYSQRYPDIPSSRWAVIPNGFDETNFRKAEASQAAASTEGPVTLIHSGVVYPGERDPRPFFAALSALKKEGVVSADTLRVRLRATGYDQVFRPLIDTNDIADIVSLAPKVNYQEALAEMLTADGLLVLQASNCNHQIPAKIYEYLRAGRPILALTDLNGDTADELRGAGIDTIGRLDDADSIKLALTDFISRVKNGQAPVAQRDTVGRYSRRARTRELVKLLDDVVATDAGAVLN